MDELENIKMRYQRRSHKTSEASPGDLDFSLRACFERERLSIHWIRKHLDPLHCRALEIGAGHGDNFNFLKRAGIPATNIFLNELLEPRLESLRSWYPSDRILPGNAIEIPEDQESRFDLILQFTVFSSILDPQLQKDMITKIHSLLKPGGYFLWYDMRVDNPFNKDVQGISPSRARELCEKFSVVETQRVTLLPQLARKVGSAYNLFSLFPFLRTHQLILFKKTS